MAALTRQQATRLDRLALEEYGIPGVVLMENAGRSVCELLWMGIMGPALWAAPSLWRRRAAPASPPAFRKRVVILCGGGNNGGDGYVIARHLHNAGARIVIYAAADPATLSGEAAIHKTIAQKMGLKCHAILNKAQLQAAVSEWRKAHLIVDALLGTGFSGVVRPHIAEVIQACNALERKSRILAVDAPSGLDCDTGQPSNATIRAGVTVTFVAIKRGFLHPEARPFLGRVVVAGIGTPPELLERVLQEPGSS